MRRRDFVKAAGGIFVAWLPPAHAQHTNKIRRVAVLWHAGSASITLEQRFPDEKPERFVSLANELAGVRPDVLVAVTQQAAVPAKQATATIPVIYVQVLDPVQGQLA